MKTTIISLFPKVFVAIFLVGIVAFNATAGLDPKLKMVPYAENSALITVENVQNTPSIISIENNEADVIYYREGVINEEVYSKIFDFKKLADGDYKVNVSNVNGKSELAFKVSKGSILIDDSKDLYAPFFSTENDALKISFLNFTESFVNFEIANEDGVVFSKTLGRNFVINKGFDLSNLSSGEYTAYLTSGKKTYKYTIEK